MRLTEDQKMAIVSKIKGQAGGSARIFLYGSRVDDCARGGDVDILVESRPALSLIQRAKIKLALERELSLAIDLIACDPSLPDRPFVAIARNTALRLD